MGAAALVVVLPLLAAPATAEEGVARAVVTRAVADREPVDEVAALPADAEQVAFFSELRGMAGQTVVHSWHWNGRLMAEVPFEVGGPRWRVWSTKELLPEWAGEWEVQVVSERKEVLAARTFRVDDSAAASEPAAAEAGGPEPRAEPAAPQSAASEPPAPEPAASGPIAPEPAAPEPAAPEAAAEEPAAEQEVP